MMYAVAIIKNFKGELSKKMKSRKYPKNHSDVMYFVPGRKRQIAGSTKSTSDILAIAHKENPTFTIRQLHKLMTDQSKYIFDSEVVGVLDAHISAGYGDIIPDWR